MAPAPSKSRKTTNDSNNAKGRAKMHTVKIENDADEGSMSSGEGISIKRATDGTPRKVRSSKINNDVDSPKSSRLGNLSASKRRKRDPNGGNQSQKLTSESFIMKLFDRSLDLSKYNEQTPLYPICRAWMANQPRNTKTNNAEKRPDSPVKREDNGLEILKNLRNGEKYVHVLPAPQPEIIQRIPTYDSNSKDIVKSLDEEMTKEVDKVDLLAEHKAKWKKVKSEWIDHTNRYYERYSINRQILLQICKR